jgi:hypothetical protein
MSAPFPELIATSINTIMRNLKPILKTECNGDRNYRFASIDGFLAAINPLCARAGLVILQDEIDARLVHGGTDLKDRSHLWVTFEFSLAHVTGAYWGPITRSIMVPADGAQAFGAAQSYALKQFLRGLFQIPTGETEDADFSFRGRPSSRRTNGLKSASGQTPDSNKNTTAYGKPSRLVSKGRIIPIPTNQTNQRILGPEPVATPDTQDLTATITTDLDNEQRVNDPAPP